MVDENDNGPWWEHPARNSPLRTTVLSDTYPGTELVTLKAKDRDKGINGEVQYRIIYSTPEQDFLFINKTTGVLKLARILQPKDTEKCMLNLITELVGLFLPWISVFEIQSHNGDFSFH